MIRKKAAAGFIFFMVMMWFGTLISKSVYASRLPLVETENLQEKYIPHEVEAEGIVIEGGTLAVTTLPGLKVEKLLVNTGDRVKEGDLLLTADLEDLQSFIEEKEQEIQKLRLQIDALEQNKELAQQKKTLEEERARADYDAISRLENTDLGRAREEYAKAEAALEAFQNDSDSQALYEESREAQEQELKNALQQAAYGEADAMRERDGAILEAQRSIEDILFPESADETLSLYYLELSALKEALSPYRELLEGEGKVTATRSGTVTSMFAEPGGRTADAAVMYLSDDSLPCRFRVLLDREQKSYAKVEDQVKVTLDDGHTIEAKIDSFAESREFSGSFEAEVLLPEGIGMPGGAGKFSLTRQGELHRSCISTSSLYQKEYKTYVYVLKEREGILGKEYYVEEVAVKVLDDNGSWAKVEAVGLDEESRIISYADREIKKGDVVRWLP